MKIPFFLIVCISASWCQDIQFNRDLASVIFDPYLFLGDSNFPRDYHDKKDLIKMSKTISSKFSIVVMQSISANNFNPEESRSLIPSAIAEFNTNNSNNIKLEIYMSYISKMEDNIDKNFDIQIYLADEANKLYNGTVSTILLKHFDGLTKRTIADLTNALDYANKAKQLNSTFPYKIGVWMPMSDCYNTYQLKTILSKIDMITFKTSDASPELTSHAYFASITNSITNCQEKLQTKGKSANTQFVIWRSDTPTKGNQDVSLLVNFWEQMNQWASQTNTSILFHEAFDMVFQRGGVFKFCGWWRAENGVDGSLLDFTLEEKSSGMTTIIRPKFTDFNRNNLLVMFDPFVHPHEDTVKTANAHSALQNMLKTISTRFSKVVLREVPLSSDVQKGSSGPSIANATAHFNKNKKPQGSPMEVVIMCSTELHSENNLPTSFDIAKSLADEANAIYSGTVKTILISNQNLNSNLDRVKTQLEYSKEKISPESSFPYNVGISLPIENCGKSGIHLDHSLTQILPMVNVLYFSRDTLLTESADGMELAFPFIFKEFERCLLKIRKNTTNISIAFRATWPDTNNKGVQNISALVEFWERANDWAVALNTQVVMWEAFDNFNRKHQVYKTLGWWKLDESSVNRPQSELIFVEKSKYLKPALVTSSDPNTLQTSQGLDTMSVVIFGILGFFLLLGLMAGSVFLVYRKILGKVEVGVLTKEEKQQFFQGGAYSMEGSLACSNICSEPYNKRLELSKADFVIDETELLGSGTFGAVYRAIIKTPERDMHVAVKLTTTTNPPSAVKNLLAEIKILSHVGHHENIVGIAGAYTAEVSKGHVLVFLELCQKGSLHNYLRNYSQRYELSRTESSEYTELSPIYMNSCGLEDSGIGSHLEKWSYEIASGMEFLATKHVVHADLATRNVLLTENMTAKISDFGLSRRMYDYANYLKTQQEPLPWRWMSPESLRRMVFGEKSDVWAFGITIWEIYSFGDIPYPGLSWTVDFLQQLEQGLRPNQPRHSTQDLYNEIMLKCWELLPSSRPTFSELKEKLLK